jgi:CzcA family heavy metal efflux pump
VNFYARLRRHAAVVWLATAVLLAVGVASALTMPSSIYPEVEFPRILIVARVGGAPADVYLTTITRPLEQAMTAVIGVQRIRSKTIRGATEIALQFAPDTDMQRALQMVDARVSQERPSLPPDTEITVERVTTGSFPILTFNVTGAADPRELRELADYTVRPVLASVPGVGRVEVLGGDVREFEIILRPELTAALQLTPRDVADRIRTAMALHAVGRIERDRQVVTVMGDAQPRTLAEIRELPVAMAPGGVPVPVSDVAEVVEGHEDRRIRVGGPHGEAVGISVTRQPGASTPDVVDHALAAVAGLRASLPHGITIDPVYDQSSLVRESMASVRDAILLGIALCALVIALFLRDARAGLLAATAVPITLAIALVAMKVAHQTLNLMSLGGMAVAIGLVVDDAIVVIEAIARHRDGGFDASTAAATGSIELAPAVIGTTLTTVVVFVPLAFVQGVVGDFFRALAFTLTAAVLASLAVALLLVPLAASGGLSSRARRTTSELGRRYGALVRRLVRRPWVAVAGYALVLGLGAVAAPLVPRGFLPTMDEGAFVLDYFLPAGTSLATTEGFAKRIEAELKATREVRTFTRRTGAELGPAAATELNRGDIMVRLAPRAERARVIDDVIADVRARVEKSLPEVRVEFVQVLQDVINDLSGRPRPIEVKLFGPTYESLYPMGDRIAEKLHHVPGVVDVYNGRERDSAELRFVADRDAMARLGTTPDEVDLQLETALLGANVGAMRYADRLVGVRVRYPDPVRFAESDVLDFPFVTRSVATTFRSVAIPQGGSAPSQLMHESLVPTVDITADHEDRDLGSIANDIDGILARTPVPLGVRVQLGGQIEGERSTRRQLTGLAAFALLLVLTVLAGQFRQLRLAVLVLAVIPVAIVGALVGLLITGTPLNASSLMGCILLIGLVVKNGVLLLEGAERLAGTGSAADDAVARASDRRVRPVLMTTLATLAGLAPLALGIGAGAELQRPLAVAVIGGLVTSTVATLGLLPPLAAHVLRIDRRNA